MANMKCPKALYNVVQVQQKHKGVQDPEMQGVARYLSVFTKMVKNDVSKDQKRHKADTTESKAHDESSETKKSILGPKK